MIRSLIERWNVSQLKRGSPFLLRLHTVVSPERLRCYLITFFTFLALLTIKQILTITPLPLNVDRWIPISNYIHIYSAYADVSTNSNDIFVIGQPTENITGKNILCTLMYKNYSHTQVVTGQMQHLPSHHSGGIKSVIIVCRGEPNYVADYVGLRQAEENTIKYFPVRKRRRSTDRSNTQVGICVLSYQMHHSIQAEFLIHYWNLGARHMVVYGYTPPSDVESLIRFHLSGHLEFVEWSLPQLTAIPNRAALAADCNLRLYEKVSHILILNVQEFAVPLTYDLSINDIPARNTKSALKFRETIFCNDEKSSLIQGYQSTCFERTRYLKHKAQSGLFMSVTSPANLISERNDTLQKSVGVAKFFELFRFVQSVKCETTTYFTMSRSDVVRKLARRIAENTLLFEYNKINY